MRRREFFSIATVPILAKGVVGKTSHPKPSISQPQSRPLNMIGPFYGGQDTLMAEGPCTVYAVEIYTMEGRLVYRDDRGCGGVNLPLVLRKKETLSFEFPKKWMGPLWGKAIKEET
jgi:hypothetical protein